MSKGFGNSGHSLEVGQPLSLECSNSLTHFSFQHLTSVWAPLGALTTAALFFLTFWLLTVVRGDGLSTPEGFLDVFAQGFSGQRYFLVVFKLVFNFS